MTVIEEALNILTALGLPRKQRNERSALTLLALAGRTHQNTWKDVTTPLLRIVDIMDWMRDRFGKNYAPNSRETIRRQTIHQFEQARMVDKNPDDPDRPTNSGLTVYRLTDAVIPVLRTYGTKSFEREVKKFVRAHGMLATRYSQLRRQHTVAVTLPDGSILNLSPGMHNKLQRLILEEFAPRFINDPVLVYVGDTAEKHLFIDIPVFESLGIPVSEHNKLPDIVILSPGKNWIFLIEAVTTHGPISPKRHMELEKMLSKCPCGRVYVTAFLTFRDYRKYAEEIVWESEVWIAEAPDHMIHYNGDKFFGPR